MAHTGGRGERGRTRRGKDGIKTERWGRVICFDRRVTRGACIRVWRGREAGWRHGVLGGDVGGMAGETNSATSGHHGYY